MKFNFRYLFTTLLMRFYKKTQICCYNCDFCPHLTVDEGARIQIWSETLIREKSVISIYLNENIANVLQILYHFFPFEMLAYTFWKYQLILFKPMPPLIFCTKKHPRRVLICPHLTVDEGARTQIWTGDTAIFSRLLYQLSYPGIISNWN